MTHSPCYILNKSTTHLSRNNRVNFAYHVLHSDKIRRHLSAGTSKLKCRTHSTILLKIWMRSIFSKYFQLQEFDFKVTLRFSKFKIVVNWLLKSASELKIICVGHRREKQNLATYPAAIHHQLTMNFRNDRSGCNVLIYNISIPNQMLPIKYSVIDNNFAISSDIQSTKKKYILKKWSQIGWVNIEIKCYSGTVPRECATQVFVYLYCCKYDKERPFFVILINLWILNNQNNFIFKRLSANIVSLKMK